MPIPPSVNPLPPAPDPTASILELRNLLHLAEHVDDLAWQPFREGVDIHRLYGDGVTGPSAALLRFRQAARIPFHHHDGYEHILVLAGSQQDEHGIVTPGTLRIHPPGTSHHVSGEAGCLVLAIYEKPVRFETKF
jgi:anti-sigma factor ChrR (cupin superfamily)